MLLGVRLAKFNLVKEAPTGGFQHIEINLKGDVCLKSFHSFLYCRSIGYVAQVTTTVCLKSRFTTRGLFNSEYRWVLLEHLLYCRSIWCVVQVTTTVCLKSRFTARGLFNSEYHWGCFSCTFCVVPFDVLDCLGTLIEDPRGSTMGRSEQSEIADSML